MKEPSVERSEVSFFMGLIDGREDGRATLHERADIKPLDECCRDRVVAWVQLKNDIPLKSRTWGSGMAAPSGSISVSVPLRNFNKGSPTNVIF